jgi:hypothetical protein
MGYIADETSLIKLSIEPIKEVKENIDLFKQNIWLQKHSSDLETFVLFHYTTSEGLKGILESRSFRCTDANFLNDSLEIKYGNKIISDILNGHLRKEKNDNVKFL